MAKLPRFTFVKGMRRTGEWCNQRAHGSEASARRDAFNPSGMRIRLRLKNSRLKEGYESSQLSRQPSSFDFAMDRDEQIRAAAFQRTAALSSRFAEAIPWSELGAGFMVGGERILFCGRARGIFRPRQMRRGVLSIKTTVPRQGRQRRYDQLASDQGFFLYRFQGEDPKISSGQDMLWAFAMARVHRRIFFEK